MEMNSTLSFAFTLRKRLLLFAVLCCVAVVPLRALHKNTYIMATRSYYQPAYTDAAPASAVTAWKLPFDTPNREDIRSVKVISVFGDHRESYLRGHIHTATDLQPARKADHVYVYAMAEGVVCSIHLGHPHKTVVVKHRLKSGQLVFTSYKHLQEIYVNTGEQVTADTQLARLYTPAETKKYNGHYDHLHLEIRKSFDDYGCASWLTMNKDDLNELFYNPMDFMKTHLGIAK